MEVMELNMRKIKEKLHEIKYSNEFLDKWQGRRFEASWFKESNPNSGVCLVGFCFFSKNSESRERYEKCW
jgi:hypothetical protein